MKKSNLVVLLVSSSLLFAACDADTTATPSTSTTLTNTQTTATTEIKTPAAVTPVVNLKDQTIKEETKKYIIDVTYPTTGIIAIDTDIKKMIDDQIAPFKKDAEEMETDLMVGTNSLYIDYEHFNFNPDYISFKFTLSLFTGGAHPNTFFITKTYQVSTGKSLALSDLFKPGSEYLAKISQHSIQSLTANSDFLKNIPAEEKNPAEDAKWITEGAAAKEENFQDWVITPNNLEIYFEPYQVASYAEGAQTVDIDLAELSKFLVPPFDKIIEPSVEKTAVNEPKTPENCLSVELKDAAQAGLKVNVYDCPNNDDYHFRAKDYFSKADGVYGKKDGVTSNVIEVYEKPINQSPEDAIKKTFLSKLSAEQQKGCEIVERTSSMGMTGGRAYSIEPTEAFSKTNPGFPTDPICGDHSPFGNNFFQFSDQNAEKYIYRDLGSNIPPNYTVEILPNAKSNTVTAKPSVTLIKN